MKKTVASIRTISPGSPPDIDTDFSDEIRGKVVEHLIELYGQDKVAHIATYNTYAGKGAVKKACSIYGMPMSASAKLAASIPDNISWPKGIINGFLDPDSDIYKAGEEFRELTSDTDTWGKVVECARELEGRVVSSGHHPCGVVISAKPLGGITPVTEKDADGVKTYVTQWEYPQLESMGLIKMDLLGLSTVTLISKTVANCLKSGVDPKLVDMESFIAGGLKDEETYRLFSRGETAGIFQFSNPAVREVCRNVKPTRVEEIADITALYRPGPMDADAHNVYWKTKHGQIDPTLPHPEFKGTVVEEILSRTNNVLVYQEQVMEIASRGCGMSLTEADKLRKAMGKKKLDVMNSMKSLFVEGGMRVMGVSEKAITTLWDVIVPFSSYAFNSSHAISYGINAVQAAYLKAHFPREFIAAALDMRYGNPKDARMLMTEARNMGIRVESVDVNRSSAGFAPDFTSHEPVVLFGLSGVSGITQAVGEKIVAERETNGPFTSVEDFLTRLRSIDERLCNKKLATSFALAGAFDSLGVSRKAVSEGFTQWSQSTRKVETLNSGFGLFDLDEVMPTESGAFDSKDDYSFTEKIALESSVSGLYLSQHPLTHIKQPLKLETALKSKKTFTMKVAVFSVERKKSKGGGADRWTVVLDDGVSYCEASVSSEFAKAMATDQARAQVRRWWSKNDGSKLHPDIQKRALSPVSRAPLQAGRVYTVKLKVHPRGVILVDAAPVVLDSEGREPETLFIPKWRSPDCGHLLGRLLPKFTDSQSSAPFAALIATDPLALFDPVEAYEKTLSGEASDTKRSWSWESVFGRDAKVPYSEDDLYQALLYRPDVCELVETGANCDSAAYAYYNNLTDKQRAWFERSLFEGDRVSFGRRRLE